MKVADHKLLANLVPLDIRDFNVILGMDWLSSHHATVDYFWQVVCFQHPGNTEFFYFGECQVLPSYVILAISTRRYLRQGCEAYLAHIVDTRLNSPKVKDIPIACEFPFVFFEELLGLPLIERWSLVLT